MRQFLVVLMLSILAFAIIRPSLPLSLSQDGTGLGSSPLSGTRTATATAAPPRDEWRRTTRGWERRNSWRAAPPSPTQGIVHPALAGASILLVSLAALVAFPPRRYGVAQL